MEKPGNLFAAVKMWKKHPKETKIKKRTCIFIQKLTLGKFSVPAWANHAPGFSVRERLDQAWCIVPFKIQKCWTFC